MKRVRVSAAKAGRVAASKKEQSHQAVTGPYSPIAVWVERVSRMEQRPAG
jgi:hypothetical protein